ncbi:MAG: hypothetical protein IJ456_09660 [Bacteroides sp.]|nr:hypothetical protein [Bacteroides sp.]
MKKTIFIASCLILGVVSAFQTHQSEEPLDEFLLMNVEALATPEHDYVPDCWGTGDVTCPDGVKVETYTPNYYSLR